MLLKLPKTRRELQQMLDRSYTEGHQKGHDYAVSKYESEAKKLQLQKDQANLKALEQVTNLARATGQAIEAVCRALYDGRGM